MPAESESQRRAAGAALSAKRKGSSSKLKGASKDMYEDMSENELEDFASKSVSSESVLIKAIDTYLAKQPGQHGVNPLSVPPEKRFYTPQGAHTGPRGGKFSVIGTEVDPAGNPIHPTTDRGIREVGGNKYNRLWEPPDTRTGWEKLTPAQQRQEEFETMRQAGEEDPFGGHGGKKRKPKGVQGKQPGLLEQTDWSQEEEWMDQGVTRTLDGYYQGKPMYEYDFPEKDSKKVTKRDTPRQRKDKESKLSAEERPYNPELAGMEPDVDPKTGESYGRYDEFVQEKIPTSLIPDTSGEEWEDLDRRDFEDTLKEVMDDSIPSPRAKEVLTRKFGLGGDTTPQTNEQIGRAMGLRTGLVEVILRRGMDRIRSNPKLERLKTFRDESIQKNREKALIKSINAYLSKWM